MPKKSLTKKQMRVISYLQNLVNVYMAFVKATDRVDIADELVYFKELLKGVINDDRALMHHALWDMDTGTRDSLPSYVFDYCDA